MSQREALAKLIKISDLQAVAMLEQAPIVIKGNVDAITAQKYVSAVNKTGAEAMARVVEHEVAPLEVEASAGDGSSPEGDAESALGSLSSNDETPSFSGGGSAQPPMPKDEQPESFKGYTFQYAGKPDYGFVTVTIPKGETLKVEASAMATMDTNLVMKTKMKGGLGRLLTGENLFVNEFTAEGGAAEIGIAPGAPGDIRHVFSKDETVLLQYSA